MKYVMQQISFVNIDMIQPARRYIIKYAKKWYSRVIKSADLRVWPWFKTSSTIYYLCEFGEVSQAQFLSFFQL